MSSDSDDSEDTCCINCVYVVPASCCERHADNRSIEEDEPFVANRENEYIGDGGPTVQSVTCHGPFIPTKFTPRNPKATPQSLFPPRVSRRGGSRVTRFTHRNNASQMLLFTDGCCLKNGSSNPQGGCAVVFQPTKGRNQERGYFRFHLEARGLTGERYTQTSNRAELRATIAALCYRAGHTGREGWYNEGFKGIVIATDSAYVVEGITKWVRKLIRNGWQTSMGEDVKNKDLWQRLLGQIETFDNLDVKVQFWRIHRHLNTEADYHAKKGATEYRQETYG